jgi:uncharacterized protein
MGRRHHAQTHSARSTIFLDLLLSFPPCCLLQRTTSGGHFVLLALLDLRLVFSVLHAGLLITPEWGLRFDVGLHTIKNSMLNEATSTMSSGTEQKNVAVIGATPKEDRFAFRAMKMLKDHGYTPIPVNPAFDEVLGERCFKSISDVPQRIDTVTMYVGAARSEPLIRDIVAVRPRRIIFNPGAENENLTKEAERHGIQILNACTLVMLSSGTF